MKERILQRARASAERRQAVLHPGRLAPEPLRESALAAFEARFAAAGGEVIALSGEDVKAWLRRFAAGFSTAAVGALVPEELRPPLPAAAPRDAGLGVSIARAAIAETGSLLLDGRDGRRSQLLPPAHLIWVRERDVVATLSEALESAPLGDTAAFALHSGPSKSADIGGMLVTGVHGPGRVLVAVLRTASGQSG